jgi:Ca2+-binding EF-hand superfamily protein
MKKLFKIIDKDNSGELDIHEFNVIAKVLFNVDVSDCRKELTTEVKNEIGGLGGSIAAGIVGKGFDVGLKVIVNKQNIEEFIHKLFKEADKDENGTISFDEFKLLIKEHSEKQAFDRISGMGELKI